MKTIPTVEALDRRLKKLLAERDEVQHLANYQALNGLNSQDTLDDLVVIDDWIARCRGE